MTTVAEGSKVVNKVDISRHLAALERGPIVCYQSLYDMSALFDGHGLGSTVAVEIPALLSHNSSQKRFEVIEVTYAWLVIEQKSYDRQSIISFLRCDEVKHVGLVLA